MFLCVEKAAHRGREGQHEKGGYEADDDNGGGGDGEEEVFVVIAEEGAVGVYETPG